MIWPHSWSAVFFHTITFLFLHLYLLLSLVLVLYALTCSRKVHSPALSLYCLFLHIVNIQTSESFFLICFLQKSQLGFFGFNSVNKLMSTIDIHNIYNTAFSITYVVHLYIRTCIYIHVYMYTKSIHHLFQTSWLHLIKTYF